MRIALVYDRVNKFGGAERVLLRLHKLWPKAPLYTAVYNPKTARWADVFEVKPSFLQLLPFFRKHHQILPTLTPYAFESFDFNDFDLVFSVSSAEAKMVVTKSSVIHINYCLTPTRYLWSHTFFYQKQGFKGFLLKFLAPKLRMQDYIASQRVDKMIAISKTIQQRIKKYYNLDSEIIYPPVENLAAKFKKSQLTQNFSKKDYYLVVSRLEDYKRVDLAIEACKQLNRKLIIVGKGSLERKLSKNAGSTVQFFRDLTDFQLSQYYMHCRALIFPGEEDFGITPVEAQFFGKPVIFYNKGGAVETVIEGETGVSFSKSSVKSLKLAILKFEKTLFSSKKCQNNAQRFSQEKFDQQILNLVKKITK